MNEKRTLTFTKHLYSDQTSLCPLVLWLRPLRFINSANEIVSSSDKHLQSDSDRGLAASQSGIRFLLKLPHYILVWLHF